jgi:type IV secretory pathway TrbL component
MGVAMNFDLGEVLSRAWQITWKHKALWVIGILFGFFVSILFPLMFSPILFPVLMQNSKIDSRPILVLLVVYVIVFLLFIVVLYPIRVLVQPSLTVGVLDATENGENISAAYLRFKNSPKMQPLLSTGSNIVKESQ